MHKTKPLILLSLPVNFSIRSFFFTNVIDDLLKNNNLAIISPFCDSKSFINHFKREGITFYTNFKYDNHNYYHEKWLNRLNYVSRVKWKLYTPNHTDRILFYQKTNKNKIQNNSENKSIKRNLFDYFIKYDLMLSILYFLEDSLFKIINYKIIKQYENLLSSIKPDFVIATAPFVTHDIPLMKTVQKMKIDSALYVLSYDNITSRPPLTVFFQNYIVWNNMNKQELLKQYGNIKESKIRICGPLQFDWHHNKKKYLVSKEDWFSKLNLDINKKTILFGANVEKYSPNDEHVIKCLLKTIKKTKQDLQIIIRLHPNDDFNRWKDFNEDENLISFSMSSTKNSFVKENIISLINDIHHSDLTVCNGTSIALDGLMLGKPAIFFAYDDRYSLDDPRSFDRLTKDIYNREHIVPLVKIGGVKLVHSFSELYNQIKYYLSNPLLNIKNQEKTKKFYDPFCDGNSGERFVKNINQIINSIKDEEN